MFSARMNWNKVDLDACFYFIIFHIIRFAEVLCMCVNKMPYILLVQRNSVNSQFT